MSEYLQNIINKHIEFNTYLKDINTELFKNFSREELIEFKNSLKLVTSHRYISTDVDKIINEKKIQEYPELLGVHHYPEIKELDCISEEDKIKLDNYILHLGLSSYIQKGSNKWFELSKNWEKGIQEKVIKFLEDNKIVEKYYKITFCCESETFSQIKLNNYLFYFELKRNEYISKEDYIKYGDLLESIKYDLERTCGECDKEFIIEEEMLLEAIENSSYNIYKLVKERDKTYDDK